jgi:hypothetical protein
MAQPYRLAGRHLQPNSSDCRKYEVTGGLSVILSRSDERCSVNFKHDGRRVCFVTVVGEDTREATRVAKPISACAGSLCGQGDVRSEPCLGAASPMSGWLDFKPQLRRAEVRSNIGDRFLETLRETSAALRSSARASAWGHIISPVGSD